MKIKYLIIIILLMLFSNITYAQKKVYTDTCELVRQLLDSADKRFLKFSDGAKHATITMLDIHGLLTKCSIGRVNETKIVPINSGAEVDTIRKQGIFSASRRDMNTYVFQRLTVDSVVAFSIFHPRSNGMMVWAFVRKNKAYHFKSKNYGWF